MRAKEFIAERLGPHSGKEVEMLIAGTKPAGLLTPKEYEKLLPYIKSGQLVSLKDPGSAGWIVAQKGNEKSMHQIYDLIKAKEEQVEEFGHHHMWLNVPNTMYHATLGRLLGYSEDDINMSLDYGERARQFYLDHGPVEYDKRRKEKLAQQKAERGV